MNCPDCFKEVRSRNDIYKQVKLDAEKLSNNEQKKVAIISEGPGFSIESFTEAIPPGTIEVIVPC